MPSVENAVFALLIACCFVSLMGWTTARTFRFSPAVLFFVVFVLQQAIGSMLLAVPGDAHLAMARFGLQLGMIGFTLGVGAVTVLSRFHPEPELVRIRGRMCFQEPNLGSKLAIMAMGYMLSAAIMVLYFHQSGGIPLFQGIGAMLSGEERLAAQELLKQRRMELTYFEGSAYRGQGYVDQIRMIVLPYVFACFLLWARGSRQKRWTLLACATGLPVLVFLAGTGQRHPTLAFLIEMSIIGYAISRPEGHRKLLTIFGTCGLAVFFTLTFLLGRYTHTDSLGSDLSMVALGLWNRIAYSNAFATLAVFDLFPNPERFRYGSTWIADLGGFLPGPHVAFSAWLFRRLYGFTGTAAPMSFAEMYANFGLPGIFVGAALQGMTLQALQVWWARRPVFRAEHLVLYALLCMAFARWAMGGVLGPLQFGLLGLPPLWFCIRIGHIGLRCVGSAIRLAGADSEGTDSARGAGGLRQRFATSEPAPGTL